MSQEGNNFRQAPNTVPDPHKIEEHGVTIPVPTPTQVSVPNPYGPNTGGPAQGSGGSLPNGSRR